MSDYEFVTVQNYSTEKLKSYTDDGQLIEMGPRGSSTQIRDMTREEFESLQADYGGKVGLVERGAKSVSKFVAPKAPKSWIANMTGNPDAPDTVVGFKTNAQGIPEYGHQELNPVKAPRTIYIQGVGRRDEELVSQGGVIIKKTWPGREVALEPYSQIEVSEAEARAFRNIDLTMPDTHRGSLIDSEDISEIFQPDQTYTLDEMRAYLEMLPEDGDNFPAGRKIMGPSEFELREECAKQGLTAKEAARVLDGAKQACWQRITLRLFRPTIRKPTQKQFEQFVAKKLPKASVKPKKAPAVAGSNADLLEDL